MRYSFASPLSIGFVVVVILVLLVSFEQFLGRREAPRAAVQEQHRRESLKREQQAAEADRRVKALQLAKQATDALDEALQAALAWRAEVEPLLDGEAGLRVAAHPGLVKELSHVVYEDRRSDEDLRSLREQCLKLASDVRELESSLPPGQIRSSQLADIHDLLLQASESSVNWTTALGNARSIIRQAGRLPSEESEEVAGSLREAVLAAYDQQLIDGMSEQRAEKKRRQNQAKKDRQQAAKEHRLAIEAAESPEVARVLAPFLVPRYGQPILSGAAVRFEKQTTLQPMSLSRLEGLGVLAPTEKGLKMLARVGADRQLKPTRWTFPSEPNNWTPETRAFLNTAQKLLREHGEALVSIGKLSP